MVEPASFLLTPYVVAVYADGWFRSVLPNWAATLGFFSRSTRFEMKS